MAEDKTRKPEQLQDEQLDEVNGGGTALNTHILFRRQ